LCGWVQHSQFIVQHTREKGERSKYDCLEFIQTFSHGHCINGPIGPSVSQCGTWYTDLMATRWPAAQPLKLCKAHKQSTHTYDAATFSKLPLKEEKDGIKHDV
jgi:hypothetical protein